MEQIIDSSSNTNNIVLVVPVYNPTENFCDAILQLAQLQFYKVLVVNDGCDCKYDSSFSQLEECENIIILKHDKNKGKGRALKTAFKYILETLTECTGVVTADADGQHKTKDIIAVKNTLARAKSARIIVLGSRDFKKNDIPLRSKLGNIITRMILRYLCHFDLTDTQTGLRGISAALLEREVQIAGEGYEYETNVLLDAVNAEVDLIEIPIETVYDNGDYVSHFNPLKDSFRIYKTILMYSGSSMLSSLIDYTIFILIFPITNNIWISTYVGRCCSAVSNFTINRKAVFRDENNIFKSLLKYIILLVISGTTSAILLTLSGLFLGNIYFATKVIIEICLYFFNYYIQKKFVFGKKKYEKRK